MLQKPSGFFLFGLRAINHPRVYPNPVTSISTEASTSSGMRFIFVQNNKTALQAPKQYRQFVFYAAGVNPQNRFRPH